MSERLEPDQLHGYPIDFRSKAQSLDESPAWSLPAVAVQWGLGCYERWLAGQGEAWLQRAFGIAEELLVRQQHGGRYEGGWLHPEPLAHTYRVAAPWLSALAQGEGASLLVRIYKQTGESRFADAASSALRPLRQPVAAGGLCASLDGAPFPEEYPTDPPSFVLNGAIFALWGFHDVAIGLEDREIRDEFEQRADALARSIHRWDTGGWSRYDLFPHRLINVSSSAYHALHINQLRAFNILSPRAPFASTAERFVEYTTSRRLRTAAFARKAAFRLVVPRSPAANRLMDRAASSRR